MKAKRTASASYRTTGFSTSVNFNDPPRMGRTATNVNRANINHIIIFILNHFSKLEPRNVTLFRRRFAHNLRDWFGLKAPPR